MACVASAVEGAKGGEGAKGADEEKAQTVPTPHAQSVEPSQRIVVQKEIDVETLRGSEPDLSTGQFSVAIRFKPLAPGANTTGGAGMLFAWGSGWFDGFRAYCDYAKDYKVAFQIGRAKEGSAVSVLSTRHARPGLWHDLVCTYDGTRMRLYLDGQLCGESDFDAGLSPPQKAFTLNVGFGNFGVGSLKMEVDTLEYWTTALSEADAVARFETLPKLEREKIALWDEISFIPGAVDFSTPIEKLFAIERLEGLPPEVLRKVEESLLVRLIKEKEFVPAFRRLAALTQKAFEIESTEFRSILDENDHLSRIFFLFDSWEKVAKICPDDEAMKATFTKTSNQVFEALRDKFSAEWEYFVRIQDLDEKTCARTRLIERNASQFFQSGCSSALSQVDLEIIRLAPDGDDANDGVSAPLRTLAAALQKALELRKTHSLVIVEVGDGEYFDTECAEINESNADSAPNSPDKRGVLFVRAAEGAKPIFTKGVHLKEWKKVSDAKILARLRPEARDVVLVCDLKQSGVSDFGACAMRGYPVSDAMNPWPDLYINGKAQTLARYPNAGEPELQIGDVILPNGSVASPSNATSGSGKFRLGEASERVAQWAIPEAGSPNDFFAYGIWQWEWASKTVRVKNIDLQEKTIEVDYPNVRARFTFHFINVLEELDAPGEYYIDRESGLAYMIPSETVEDVEFSVSDEPFLRLKGVRKVVFDGLTFKCTRGTAVEISDCQFVSFENCRVGQCGVHAFVINGGLGCRVWGSELYSLGSCGVRISGGDRATLTPCGHGVSNCHIHDFCRIDRSYAPAVHALATGYYITNNLIHNSPHHALRTEGNDFLIARNEVHSVVYDFSDQSGVDIYCDPTYRGIVIRDNLWHHIGSRLALCGQAGIRLDDSISEVVMKDNIFFRSAGGFFGGIQIHGGKDNLVRGNLFLHCKTALSFSVWNNDRYLDFVRNRFSKYVATYQEFGVYTFMKDIEKHLNRNYIFNNTAWCCDTFASRGWRHQVYCSNAVFPTGTKATPQISPPLNAAGVTPPDELRAWIESLPCGRPLSHIGIQPSPLFPQGQKGISHDISPHYSEN